MLILLSWCITFTLLVCAEGYTPKEFAIKAGDKMTNLTNKFFAWDYGGSIIFDGLYRCDKTFGTNYKPLLNTFLNKYITDPNSFGYKVQHNISVPFYHAVGDRIGMFPVAYLNRASEQSITTGPDVDLALAVAEQYVLKFPIRLSDGTFSRIRGWKGNNFTTSTYLWLDDTYMGFTLLARLSRMFKNEEYAKFIAKQRISFNKHLQDRNDGLFFHGMNTVPKTLSCCKWGRANGWSITASVEVLLTLIPFKESLKSEWNAIMDSFRRHARGMVKHQSSDGRWHQLVDDDTSFLETSCTAMTLSSIARAVNEGWLDRKEFEENLHRGWKGLQTVLKADGTVNGVCVGTGILPAPIDYRNRGTSYIQTRNGGIGFVYHAAVDYHNFLASSAVKIVNGQYLLSVHVALTQAVYIYINYLL
ncbi:unsaturated rhamnogalacturonyl hydrolase YesR-like isoform X1 [Gigantopelta aegis]|uniref:unsaturated rhamnogalacturonyl hydrolase YesR-like isoform X1 n=1 Tax=Gigantopelta aegis TaxID=1735272 RepID=UPI001B88C0C4|nr:unsaturated rhamnogalacturonyl hydrolase YesR-like isoform X1 [Gigantopelta aegis]